MNQAKITLLIVDDHPDIQTLMKVAFDQLGFEVLCAGDSETAYQTFCNYPIDIAIIDQQLPRRSGIELGKKLRQTMQDRHIPLILFTGNSSKDLESEAAEAGFDAFLVKPVSIDMLHRTVRSLLEIK